MVWEVRESGLGATAHVPGQTENWEGWEDSAVPPEKVGAYLRDLRKLLDKYGYRPSLYGHFGQGCVHCRDRLRPEDGRGHRRSTARSSRRRPTWSSRYGGSLSGEHGDGQARARAAAEDVRRGAGAGVPRVQGDLGPGLEDEPRQGRRSVPRSTENLRSAPTTTRREPKTHFQYPRRRRQLRPRRACAASASAKCRAEDGGTMCPSYMVTREEKHSTRGRARLLFEMLQGDPLDRRLEERGGQGGARPLPRLQGLQGRLPGQRGHGDLQGGVPVALLRGPPAAAARLRVRPDPLVGAAGVAACPAWPTSSRRRPACATSPSALAACAQSAGFRPSRRRRSRTGSGASRAEPRPSRR